MDFQNIASAALRYSEAICRSLFPLGRKRGHEYVIGDINGKKGDSLSINLHTGIWKDFADGHGGGDLISLVASIKRMTQKNAAEWLINNFGIKNSEIEEVKLEEFIPILPAPSDIERSRFSHPSLGMPKEAYQYLDHNGNVLNYVVRFEPKTYRAITYGKYKDKEDWFWKQIPKNRPLYGLDTLKPPQVIIVEGEKAAEALKNKSSDYSVITWSGGTQNIAYADWSPLYSKEYDVILWPDNDTVGINAMNTIAQHLNGKVNSIKILNVSSMPAKGDAADFNGNVNDFIAKNSSDWKPDDDFGNALYKIPFNPMELDGMIGNTIRWIVKHSMFRQPELAMLNTLAFAGAVFGRRYASEIDTRTNVYIVGTAGTGEGKDHSRKMIKKLAIESGLECFIGPDDIISSAGLLKDLNTRSSQVMMIDEFGMFLSSVNNPLAPSYIRSITKAITTLYSTSNSVYSHGTYASSGHEDIIIYNPNVCIYGTSTEEAYIPALRKSAIESGELNRFIIFPARELLEKPARKIIPYTRDDLLVEQWNRFKPATLAETCNSGSIVPTAKTVKWGECSDIEYALRCMQMNKIKDKTNPTKALWSRCHENTVKIAMIFAIARDKDNPVMTIKDFDIAQYIVECSINYVERMANESMSETANESLNQEFIKEMRKANGAMNRTTIFRKFRKLKKRDLDDLLSSLIEQDIIEIKKVPSNGGRPFDMYCLINQ